MNNRNLFLIFLLISVATTTVFSQTTDNLPTKNRERDEDTVAIEKENPTVDVESLTFDKNRALLGCPPWDSMPKEGAICTKEESLIKVTTKKTKTTEKDLEYYYSVSGGKIIGQGANVVWDLGDERPGNFTITAGVGKDFVILGKTLSKTIELDECHCPDSCVCPEGVKILGPAKPIKAGDLIVLKAKVTGEVDFMIYNWKITNGTIVSGQRTSQVLVKINSAENKELKVTVEVSTDNYCDCLLTTSKSFQIK